jgi:chromosome segregation ATPase
MARQGIPISEVLRARTALLAAGTYPSADAVRAFLGTGSKATIHRHLKTLAAGTMPAQLSEALQATVQTLAEQLALEAEARVGDLQLAHEAAMSKMARQLQHSEQMRVSLEEQLLAAQHALASAEQELESATERERRVRGDLGNAYRQVAALQDTVATAELQHNSLVADLTHARESLEHFRRSAKAARESENTRHAAEIQTLSREVIALRTELSDRR